jgi:hypothetical protein
VLASVVTRPQGGRLVSKKAAGRHLGGAYNDLLTLWKEAYPDISILKQAIAESTKPQLSNPGLRFQLTLN